MKARELFKSLREGHIFPIYVFCGCEVFLKDEALRRLKKLTVTEGSEELDFVSLDNPSFSQIIENAETYPFVSTKRLILIHDLSIISKDDVRSNKVNSDEINRFLTYIQSLPPTCCLVIDGGESIDKRSKTGKALSQLDGYVTFDPLEEGELVSFLMKQAKRANVELQKDACERLLYLCGNDLSNLLNELEKLIAFETENRIITAESVEALSVRSTEIRIFDMIDNTVCGRISEAYQQLDALISAGETRLGIISLIARQIRQMLYIEAMYNRRKTQNEISALLGIKPFLIGKIRNRSQRIGKIELQKQLQRCIQFEFSVKNGSLNEEDAVTQILFSFNDKYHQLV